MYVNETENIPNNGQVPFPITCPHLDENDKAALETGQWLSDKHICAAQVLLKKQFPAICGLQPPFLEQANQFDVLQPGGVQILNANRNHWVCVSSMSCSVGTLDVYNSFKSTITSDIARQCSSLLQTPKESITLHQMQMQQQSGGSDCGLFAIATATALCFGIPPNSCEWEQRNMRKHLLKCFVQGKMEPFPGKSCQSATEKVLSAVTVKVYCSCRLPHNPKKKMASCSSCKEWFHNGCEDISQTVFQRKAPFVCSRCSTK